MRRRSKTTVSVKLLIMFAWRYKKTLSHAAAMNFRYSVSCLHHYRMIARLLFWITNEKFFFCCCALQSVALINLSLYAKFNSILKLTVYTVHGSRWKTPSHTHTLTLTHNLTVMNLRKKCFLFSSVVSLLLLLLGCDENAKN